MPKVDIALQVRGVLHFHMPDGSVIDCPFQGLVEPSDDEEEDGDHSRQSFQDGGA